MLLDTEMVEAACYFVSDIRKVIDTYAGFPHEYVYRVTDEPPTLTIEVNVTPLDANAVHAALLRESWTVEVIPNTPPREIEHRFAIVCPLC